jgi:hypothetical protein
VTTTWTDLSEQLVQLVDRLRVPGSYRYRFSLSAPHDTLYSSAYAAMILAMVNRLPARNEREEWVSHLLSYQDEDGLFRDPEIFDEGWYRGDPLWCGRSHLTCHVVTALDFLTDRAPCRPLTWLEPFYGDGTMTSWLEGRDWARRSAWVGNEIMNVATLLQFQRDRFCDRDAGAAISEAVLWLPHNLISPETGLWGRPEATDGRSLSNLIMTSYHIWPLLMWDDVEIPHRQRAIDSLLASQNELGGFGWGWHNPTIPSKGSACEDIDTIQPLAHFCLRTSYRRTESVDALVRARCWVMENQVPASGFVFVMDRDHDYGHLSLSAVAGEPTLFASWFRALSLAYIDEALQRLGVGTDARWQFANAPGLQFSNLRSLSSR